MAVQSKAPGYMLAEVWALLAFVNARTKLHWECFCKDSQDHGCGVTFFASSKNEENAARCFIL